MQDIPKLGWGLDRKLPICYILFVVKNQGFIDGKEVVGETHHTKYKGLPDRWVLFL
mgnify:CR=1 FL=1